MKWASTMAGKAREAANDHVSGDRIAQHNVSPESWDPHQIWLTRVKQPRDSQRRVPDQSPLK